MLASEWRLPYSNTRNHSSAIFPPTPRGVDLASLTMNSNLTAQHLMDQAAFTFGLQLGAYGDQVAGNTTTAVAGSIYLKDNYGYGAISGPSNALQQVAGIEIAAQCHFFA
ncbi:hypothetical protein GGX14DRAFT_402104 [Mycena pura]|uniref:Uncharacterized protein n=1 Tax=Mycena pura TaxID=153505 RepID=A0AAD6V162_9AGAR|nr:hypothetical protein GGX14DRAFT_402104 [Mycena pura]